VLKQFLRTSCMFLAAVLLTFVPFKVSHASSPPSMDTVKNLVSKLFYGERVAAHESWVKVTKYNFAHDYPGSYWRDSFFLQATQDKLQYKFCTRSVTPDLSTVTRVYKWVAPKGDYTLWRLGGKTPKGYTYTVTAMGTCVVGSGHGLPTKWLAHITVLDGKAYYYLLD
jgi:hypothetical protein